MTETRKDRMRRGLLVAGGLVVGGLLVFTAMTAWAYLQRTVEVGLVAPADLAGAEVLVDGSQVGWLDQEGRGRFRTTPELHELRIIAEGYPDLVLHEDLSECPAENWVVVDDFSTEGTAWDPSFAELELIVERLDDSTALLVVNGGCPVGSTKRWSLQRASQEPKSLGRGQSAMFVLRQLAASPDGRYLAVVSSGEGHPVFELVDLPLLITQGRNEVLRNVDPYPGSVGLRGWEETGVLIASYMLLDLAERLDEFDRDCLSIQDQQVYLVTAPGGELQPRSAIATNPVPYLLEQLSSEYRGYRRCAAAALALIGSTDVLEHLTAALQREEHAGTRLAIEEAIRDLERAR